MKRDGLVIALVTHLPISLVSNFAPDLTDLRADEIYVDTGLGI